MAYSNHSVDIAYKLLLPLLGGITFLAQIFRVFAEDPSASDIYTSVGCRKAPAIV